MAELNREQIKTIGWRFGSLFTEKSSPQIWNNLVEGHQADGGLCVVLTNDCSIITPSLRDEPFIEYILLEGIEAPHGMFLNGKNQRKLDVQANHEGEEIWYRLSIANRGFASREGLETCTPHTGIEFPDESIRTIKRWLSNRYIGHTLPDRFNELIAPLINSKKKPLVKAFETPAGKACYAVYLSLAPKDRDTLEGEEYSITITLLFDEEDLFELGREQADTLGKKIEDLFSPIDGIGPIEVYPVADTEVSFSDIVKMQRWQFDYLSLRDESAELIESEHP